MKRHWRLFSKLRLTVVFCCVCMLFVYCAEIVNAQYRSAVWERYLLEGEASLEAELKAPPETHGVASNAEKLLLLALEEAKKLGPNNVKMVRPLEDLARLYAHQGRIHESDTVSKQATEIRQTPG
ncbi:MAG: hypothetical protein ACRD3W_09940, partial [Terriglobales bacterium]